jgi:hypothetical protein
MGVPSLAAASRWAAGIPVEDSGGRDFWGNAIPEGKKPSIGA